jgi:hypothetical protein
MLTPVRSYRSNHTSSKRQLLKMLLWFSTNPFIVGCQQVAARP